MARIERRGLRGDREYTLLDEQTGKVVSVKYPKRWGRIFELTATIDDRVRIRFPDGSRRAIDDDELPEQLSAFFGRHVAVVATPPEHASFDEVWERELNRRRHRRGRVRRDRGGSAGR